MSSMSTPQALITKIAPTLAFEARYDRRRLDHVIEGLGIGQPKHRRNLRHRQPRPRCEQHVRHFYNFLYDSLPDSRGLHLVAPACPPTIPAAARLCGVESA